MGRRRKLVPANQQQETGMRVSRRRILHPLRPQPSSACAAGLPRLNLPAAAPLHCHPCTPCPPCRPSRSSRLSSSATVRVPARLLMQHARRRPAPSRAVCSSCVVLRCARPRVPMRAAMEQTAWARRPSSARSWQSTFQKMCAACGDAPRARIPCRSHAAAPRAVRTLAGCVSATAADGGDPRAAGLGRLHAQHYRHAVYARARACSPAVRRLTARCAQQRMMHSATWCLTALP